MIVYIELKNRDGTWKSLSRLLNFVFEKEAYTPYTTFRTTAFGNELPEDFTELKFYINGKQLHHGTADTYKKINEKGGVRGYITSRGFTSLLTENQLPPGTYTDMTLNKLFDNYFALPNITHENNEQSSYIFVNRGTPMWDGAVNLAYKLTGAYPYIRNANKFMMSMPTDAKNVTYTLEDAVNYGSELNTKRIVSHYHMADISGNYGTYEYIGSEAEARSLIRHHHFELDRRFLYSPENACQFRGEVSMRGYKRRFFTYNGYKGEDLNDIVSFEDISGQRVKAVKITGGQKGVFTELSVYEDLFS